MFFGVLLFKVAQAICTIPISGLWFPDNLERTIRSGQFGANRRSFSLEVGSRNILSQKSKLGMMKIVLASIEVGLLEIILGSVEVGLMRVILVHSKLSAPNCPATNCPLGALVYTLVFQNFVLDKATLLCCRLLFVLSLPFIIENSSEFSL